MGSPTSPAPPAEPTGRFARTVSLWMGVDTRSLAALRVGTALLILNDLIWRACYLTAHYSDVGVLPRLERIEMLERGRGNAESWWWSLHMMSGEPWVLALLFAFAAWFALQLLVGYRTRRATLISFVMLASVQMREPTLLEGGDVLMRCMMFWMLFVPLGAAWSVDRGLDPPGTPRPRRVLSLASAALLIQLASVYLITAAHKQTHPDWTSTWHGVYYALQIDHFTTPLGTWLGGQQALCAWLSRGTMVLEWVGPVLLLLPIGWAPLRVMLVGAFWSFHLGLHVSLELGHFPFVAIVMWLPVLPSAFWDRLGGWLARTRHRAQAIVSDPASPAAHRAMLLLRQLLMLEAVPLQAASGRVEGWAVVDAGGQVAHGAVGAARLVAGSPWAWPLAGLVRRPPLAWLIVWHQRRLSSEAEAADPRVPGRTAAPAQWRLSPPGQALVLALLVYVTLWNLRELDWERYEPILLSERHTWVGRATGLNQSWRLFSPCPMRADGWFVLEGRLRDGTRVDLWTAIDGRLERQPAAQLYARPHALPWTKPARVADMYPDWRWRKLLMNLWSQRHHDERGTFVRWLRHRWAERLAAEPSLDDATRRLKGLRSVHMHYMLETTPPPGDPLPAPRKVVLWKWYE